jgi:hypothetical protein
MTSSERRRYFVNGPIDFLCVGGLSMLAFIGVRVSGLPGGSSEVFAFAFLLQWISNFPHFAASTARLYESPDHVRQYPLTALVVPWLIVSGMVAAFLAPSTIAPYWVKLFLIWSPYHYSGQSLGISLVYAYRSGYFIGPWQRRALSTFIYGTFISQTARGEVGDSGGTYFSVTYPGFGLPDWRFPGRDEFLVVDAADMLMFGSGLLFVALVLYRWLVRRERAPLMLFVPAVAQYVWFVEGPFWKSYLEFVPFFHSLQYLFIVWAVRLKGRVDRGEASPSLRFVLWETLDWSLLILQGGLILFWLLPLVGEIVSGVTALTAFAIVSAGAQIHHFFVDGVIWKLRTKSVSSPLMMNIDDLLRPAANMVPASAS